ncbi:MAG: TRAP transporter large permease subunit [Candidatus Accumulibacter sp.]|jgi:tripartite ATP-independent transporter DctM subunit|nr:TRAP transporter large permease subunit [Accumulibacter sp.]
MDPVLPTILIAILFMLLGSGVWVAFALIAVGFAGLEMFTSSPSGSLAATSLWTATNSWACTALPLFIWMAEILHRTRLANDMFSGLAPWLIGLPGRLLHVNILACGIFAAVSGSSAATAATVAKITVPELSSRGYDQKMTICTLAGSGTLGILVPPSVVMIIYGFVTDTSIARLFIAGVGPSVMMVLLFMTYVGVWALLNPGKTPPADIHTSFRQKIWGSRRLIPVVTLIVLVIGSIYAGYATPTEAAALGVAGALLISQSFGTLTRRNFTEALMGATRTSCFIIFIVAAASYLSTAMSFSGIPQSLARTIVGWDLSYYGLLAILGLLYLFLGCFLDNYSMILLTMGVVQPLLKSMGVDLVWFGIFVVITSELAQLTPPVGFNLFVLQNYTGKNIFFVAKAAFPFFCLLAIGLVLITVFPGIVLYLPSRLLG